MDPFYVFVFILVFLTCYIFLKNLLKGNNNRIPTVGLCLPIFGHGLELTLDPLGFMNRCREKHGNIFRIKVFRRESIIICDRKVLTKMANINEEKLSMYSVLNEVYFREAFCDSINTLFQNTLKKGIIFKLGDVLPKLQTEALWLISFLKTMDLDKPLTYGKQTETIQRFTSRASTNCFLGMDMNNTIFDGLKKFCTLLNRAILASYVAPLPVVDYFAQGAFNKARKQIQDQMEPIIEQYQRHPELKDSSLLRVACDSIDPKTGNKFTNEQVGIVLLNFFFGSTQNSGFLTQSVLVDLASNPKFCDELREEVGQYISRGDIIGLCESRLLHAAVMETSRLYTSLIGMVRKCHQDVSIAGHFFRKGDTLNICLPLMMLDEKVFKNPLKYDPHRFLGDKPESWDSHSVITWGTGTHLCPGKRFAIFEVEFAVSHIIHNFRLEIPSSEDVTPSYATASPFVDRKVKIKFTPI